MKRNKTKKKKPETVEWNDLKVGDFVESEQNQLFCFMRDSKFLNSPSCLGRNKNKFFTYRNYLLQNVPTYTRMKPTKAFVKICRKLLDLNLKDGHVDNLNYVEALAALKKYD